MVRREEHEGMKRIGYFLAGFASGWAVRTTVDSSRALTVNLIAGVMRDRSGRAGRFGMEREHLEDLMAEARAKYEADRQRAARASQPPRPSRPSSAGRAA